jgi:hypothetical protein
VLRSTTGKAFGYLKKESSTAFSKTSKLFIRCPYPKSNSYPVDLAQLLFHQFTVGSQAQHHASSSRTAKL